MTNKGPDLNQMGSWQLGTEHSSITVPLLALESQHKATTFLTGVQWWIKKE